MPIYNLYKEREGTARRGEDYKEVVIEYMEGLNYMVERDSAFHSTLDDIQFVNKATGDKVVAEAKAYSTGLSPNDFRDELARYFLEYIKQPQPHRFDFYIFTETLSNDQLWKALFDRDVTDNQKLVDFYEKLKDSVNDEVVDRLDDTDVDEFRDFAIDTHVFVGTYDDLRQQAHQLEKTERFQYEPYLHSYEPVSEETEYATNLFQVTRYPETLYIIETTEEAESTRVYNYNNEAFPIKLHERKLYSLVHPDHLPGSTRHYIHEDRFETREFEEFLRTRAQEEERENIVRSLLRGIFTLVARDNDCLIDREKGTTVYPELDRRQHGTERKLGRSWVAKELDSYPDVIHRGVKVRVRRYAGEYYYVLLPTQVFTSDGRRPVTGERKSRLQNDFSPNRFHAQNSKYDRQLRVWEELLMSDQTQLDRFMGEKIPVVKELEVTRVDSLSLNVRPPRDGDERDELIESASDLENTGGIEQ
ncbi:hypothetical protein M0R89_22520 (plasmid) [Halorussus limi]|uniref:Restriction endonuclease n=1 Tax=Halorussus limi TaxID=2938695 RepID=A0A8U0I2Z6_9EURY|nr:hypothetical protein [Halorussus limi]UPV77014.1 hypothetical protein M0R89_22520 [Halorussus limi]